MIKIKCYSQVGVQAIVLNILWCVNADSDRQEKVDYICILITILPSPRVLVAFESKEKMVFRQQLHGTHAMFWTNNTNVWSYVSWHECRCHVRATWTSTHFYDMYLTQEALTYTSVSLHICQLITIHDKIAFLFLKCTLQSSHSWNVLDKNV